MNGEFYAWESFSMLHADRCPQTYCHALHPIKIASHRIVAVGAYAQQMTFARRDLPHGASDPFIERYGDLNPLILQTDYGGSFCVWSRKTAEEVARQWGISE